MKASYKLENLAFLNLHHYPNLFPWLKFDIVLLLFCSFDVSSIFFRFQLCDILFANAENGCSTRRYKILAPIVDNISSKKKLFNCKRKLFNFMNLGQEIFSYHWDCIKVQRLLFVSNQIML